MGICSLPLVDHMAVVNCFSMSNGSPRAADAWCLEANMKDMGGLTNTSKQWYGLHLYKTADFEPELCPFVRKVKEQDTCKWEYPNMKLWIKDDKNDMIKKWTTTRKISWEYWDSEKVYWVTKNRWSQSENLNYFNISRVHTYSRNSWTKASHQSQLKATF